jgi:hypothetical protein
MTKKNPLIIKDAKTVAKEQEAQQKANQKAAAAKLADYSEKRHAEKVTKEEIKKITNPEAASAAKKDLDELVKNTKLQTETVLKKIEEKYIAIKQETKTNQPTQAYARESFSGQAPNVLSRKEIAQRQNSTPSGKLGDDIRHAHSDPTFDPNKVRTTSKTSTTSKITSTTTHNNETKEKSKGQAI